MSQQRIENLCSYIRTVFDISIPTYLSFKDCGMYSDKIPSPQPTSKMIPVSFIVRYLEITTATTAMRDLSNKNSSIHYKKLTKYGILDHYISKYLNISILLGYIVFPRLSSKLDRIDRSKLSFVIRSI